MRFQFSSGNAILKKAVNQGGLGMSDDEVGAVRVWQGQAGYVFEFHSGMHGDPCIYVNSESSPIKRDVPCIWLSGKKALTWRNQNSLKGRDSADAEAVVRGNQALFLRFHKSFNT